MSELAAAIAPDIKAQDVTFSSGRISVRVSEQGELQSVNISCSGALHLILSDAPVRSPPSSRRRIVHSRFPSRRSTR